MKSKICKIHNKELTPERGEFTGILTGRYECTDCIDNFDFWLPLIGLVTALSASVYYAIFPISPEPFVRYGLLFIGLICILLFLMEGSTWRVLKRLYISQPVKP